MTFKIGLIYWGAKEPFQSVTVGAKDKKEALSIAADYLKPNHMQTLVVMQGK